MDGRNEIISTFSGDVRKEYDLSRLPYFLQKGRNLNALKFHPVYTFNTVYLARAASNPANCSFSCYFGSFSRYYFILVQNQFSESVRLACQCLYFYFSRN